MINSMVKILAPLAICSCCSSHSLAQIAIGDKTDAVFASVDQGKQILTKKDEYVARMSPFDRAARLKVGSEVSEAEYLNSVGKSVLSWDDGDKSKVVAALQSVQKQLETLSLPFPEKVYFIKSTGKDQAGAPYTRSNAIILPRKFFLQPAEKIRHVIGLVD